MQSLKKFLTESGMAQSALAEKLGVSQPTVSAWLAGEFRPDMGRLAAISRITGVAVEKLVRELDRSAA
jgi:transcriptional regulator with XRE-family HTH domain